MVVVKILQTVMVIAMFCSVLGYGTDVGILGMILAITLGFIYIICKIWGVL